MSKSLLTRYNRDKIVIITISYVWLRILDFRECVQKAICLHALMCPYAYILKELRCSLILHCTHTRLQTCFKDCACVCMFNAIFFILTAICLFAKLNALFIWLYYTTLCWWVFAPVPNAVHWIVLPVCDIFCYQLL